ncbi:MAG: hypothetical protein Q9172_005722 [Xanthocarpia lactea]
MGDNQVSQGLGDPKLLEVIDKLVELNIGDSVALPQLLVVGDQSSGKSSVLEGLTGLPFPRDSALCTRFATQITFRRASESATRVSIIPDKSASNEDATRMKAWERKGLRSLDRKNFSEILEEVQKVMGIGNVNTGATKSFSDDVLRIEVAGPNQEHLGVVDVPGIFRKITEGVTTQIDIANVRAMAERYMDNPRSVILAVVPANVDIATQEILELAKKYDVEGDRTLGVLTKPDLVDKGAEDHVVRLVQGTSHSLRLGWCMVKNPGQQDLQRGDDFDRHASEEAFFRNEVIWSKLDKDKVGVRSLRIRLAELLTGIVRKEFNHVRMDVVQQLQLNEKALKAMGRSRESKERQQRYLLDIADRFQTMTTQALEAHYYSDDAFDSRPSLKLATIVVERNENFSDDIWRHGHTMKFSQEATGDDLESLVDSDAESEEGMIHTRYRQHPDELNELLYNTLILAAPKEGIMDWIEEVYKCSRGFEIGTFDASLIPILWKKQSSNWDKLALGYISDIISAVHTYIWTLLCELCPDDKVARGLLSLIQDKLIERYNRGIDKTRSILQVEREPMTYNHYLADNLKKWLVKLGHQRIKTMLKSKVIRSSSVGEIVKISDLDDIPNLSNIESTVQQLHDILKSYYKVARKRFVDVVCMQAADLHLVRGPDAAVKVLTPAFVTDLTSEQMERIAGEDASTRRRRAELIRLVENLSQARALLGTV